MTKKTDKEIIKELKTELEHYKEQHIALNPEMYSISLSTWENGSGSSQVLCICRTLKDAVIVREGIRKVIPSYHSSDHGDSKIRREHKVEIDSCHLNDVKDFVEKTRW